jgi:uncharacterized protein YunC (DUF1805 family)
MKERVLKENEIEMPDGKIFEIKPIKLKYMINKDFLGYTYIEEIGIVEVFRYSDGYQIVKRFLTSIFNDEVYVESIIDNIDTDLLEQIIKIAKRVMKIKEQDDILKNALEKVAEGVSQ